MKNIFLSAIALITFGMAATEADAQYYIVKDGKVIAHSDADLLDYISFEKPSFTVTFDSGEGATAVKSQEIQFDSPATKPANPKRDGYSFKGWYNGEEPFDFSEPINGDVNLTAKWVILEAVDLGLPSGTKWATFNVGASAPEEFGDYFAWGETEPHYADGHSQDNPCIDWRDDYNGYNWANYKWVEEGGNSWADINKYTFADNQKSNGETFVGDNKKELDDEDDVAVQLWGGDWQMPTYEQQVELRDKCYWVWTDNYKGKSVNGYIVYKVKADADKVKKATYDVATDTHIFLPAAGHRYDARLYGAGSYGYYWSRSLDTDNSGYAHYLYFYSGVVYTLGSNRYYGHVVRAVQRKN